MADIKVKVSDQDPLRIKVGQQNSVKVISSLKADYSPAALISQYSNISGFSTYSGISSSVIGGIASVTDASITNLSVSGTITFQSNIKFDNFNPPNGIGYFNNDGFLVSSASTFSPAPYNGAFIFSIDESGVPVWASSIDGGHY